MKKHNGMRPHDIVILLKIIAKGEQRWMMKDLANELDISPSEITESLNRSVFAGLIAPDKRMVIRTALLDFLVYGVRYVYPVQPGALVRGMPTAWSAEPLRGSIAASEDLVWPMPQGSSRGQAVNPLHPSVPKACMRDGALYALLTLVDALRLGRAREVARAIEELKVRML